MVDDGSRILAGRYEVGELIGRGGMAEVHIGHDTRLGRTVAIKILRSDLARDPSFQARFRREAQAAAGLNHPSIVAVYDTGEDVYTEPTGAVAHVPFIVMEYVEGHTVRDILRDGQAVPIEEAIEITAGVLSALEYSHHAGIVHRDIKPANVMLTPTGAVKVMDFGIARAVADSAATMTQTQAVIGTAQYLSPEQARGETVDARSDLYSAGCLLFELLTGRPPFVGDSPVAVAYQHVREIAPAPSSVASDVPEVLDRITAKALAKERDARYSSAAEFRADLEAAARGGHVSAPAVAALGAGAATQVMGAADAGATQVMPGGAPAWAPTGPGTSVLPPQGDEEPEDETKSKRWLWITLSVVAAIAIGGIIWLLMQNREEPVAQVPVPDVVGQVEADAVATLTEAGFETRRESAASTTVAEGSVISTDPEGGTQAADGSTVTVVVSGGPDAVSLPDLSGYTQDQARQQIEGLGLTVGAVTEEDDPAQPAGRVLRTDPAGGQSIPEGTAVAVFISSGNVQLESLEGAAQADAQARLNALNLGTSIVSGETSDPNLVGKVIGQDRIGLLEQRTVVTLTIGAAPTTVQIPNDVIGKLEADATAQLQALNLQVQSVESDQPSNQPAGTVLSTDPRAGTQVQPGSTVTLVLSRGPATGGGNGGGSEGDTSGG
ncbi:Stk1 family PASTA domain-containing Ser/Thr kinase [Cellulomonas triticagri]|uniref:non-specific serine/threonine protein kinase n=1 Tax=Cellulomonas triticagri TaxID=2483352 RepID=A0A3M2JKT3_9CELL|nr:Stk1 family PASTA domain-containing Ser/Thr kinase [Cellulomonas triticagri]RMI14452.1 Stk1 family PASTA domain-containing Ser/Thr kinase [Cellulomonas triticagri]